MRPEVKCRRCRKANPSDSQFCAHCGAKLAAVNRRSTRSRADDTPPGDGFSSVPPGRLDGERRQVTVMFCDMAGFTSMVSSLGPEASYTLMNQIYEILIR